MPKATLEEKAKWSDAVDQPNHPNVAGPSWSGLPKHAFQVSVEETITTASLYRAPSRAPVEWPF